MFCKKLNRIMAIAAILFILQIPLRAQYEISRGCFVSGCAISTNAEYKLCSTIGQCITGKTASGKYYIQSGFSAISKNITAIARDPHIMPGEFDLLQNYPNPFNPLTTIKFNLPKAMQIRVAVYDILGRHVQTLTEGFKPAGAYTITFDASHLASGVYLYSIRSKEFNAVRKMVVTK